MVKQIKYTEAVSPAEPLRIRVATKIWWVCFVVIVFCTAISFGRFLKDIPIYTLVFFVLYGLSLFFRTHERVPSELVITFYDDRVELYRHSYPYLEKHNERQIISLLYKDLSVKYVSKNKKMILSGNGHYSYYLFNKDGSLKDYPHSDKDGWGIYYFYTNLDTTDIVSVFNENTPCTVKVV